MRNTASKQIREMVIFAMLGTLMFVSKIVMEILPNMHLLGTLTVLYTVVFRKKALIPIYIYVMMNGVYSGFSMWWIPYLYVWAVLWGAVMLIPKSIPDKAAVIVYPLISAAHGFLFGVLYAPLQAAMFGLDFNGMIAWIAAGFPFDLVHGISNFALGFLILPLVKLLRRLMGGEYLKTEPKETENGAEELHGSEN